MQMSSLRVDVDIPCPCWSCPPTTYSHLMHVFHYLEALSHAGSNKKRKGCYLIYWSNRWTVLALKSQTLTFFCFLLVLPSLLFFSFCAHNTTSTLLSLHPWPLFLTSLNTLQGAKALESPSSCPLKMWDSRPTIGLARTVSCHHPTAKSHENNPKIRSLSRAHTLSVTTAQVFSRNDLNDDAHAA